MKYVWSNTRNMSRGRANTFSGCELHGPVNPASRIRNNTYTHIKNKYILYYKLFLPRADVFLACTLWFFIKKTSLVSLIFATL